MHARLIFISFWQHSNRSSLQGKHLDDIFTSQYANHHRIDNPEFKFEAHIMYIVYALRYLDGRKADGFLSASVDVASGGCCCQLNTYGCKAELLLYKR